ncbi:MAG: hypothetical protein AAB614_01330 [Patescibacteria group bacterium]
MRLQRKLVKLLQSYYENSGVTPTRKEFLNFVLSRKTTNKKEKLERIFNDALGDCIEGPFQYIGYADPYTREKLKVTLEGRDFIGFGGFFQEFFKRRDKLSMFVLGGGVATIVSIVVWIVSIVVWIVGRVSMVRSLLNDLL